MSSSLKVLLVYICVFFFNYSLNAQKNDEEKIRHLLSESNRLVNNNDLKSLEYAKQASALADAINNSALKAESYLNVAKCLLFLGEFKESINYIEKGEKEPSLKSDFLLKAHFKEIKAYNYSNLGLFDQELKEYLEILKIIPSKKDFENQRLRSRIEYSIATHYYNNKKYTLAEKYINKSLKTQSILSEEFSIYEYSDILLLKGYLCLDLNKKDSSLFFFNKSLEQTDLDNIENKYAQFNGLGDFYFKTKNYQESIVFYQKTLANVEKYDVKNVNFLTDLYKSLAESYKMLNDNKNEKKYLDLYYRETEKLVEVKNNSTQSAVNLILQDENENQKKAKYINYASLTIILFSALGIIVFLNLRFRKIRKKKRKIIQHHEKELEEKTFIIQEIMEKEKELEQKLLINLEEVLEDARKNKPTFYTKFQILYPSFQSKILEINPQLNQNDLILLAYIFLNFTTKEIAEYSFRSTRTIQNRKYHLRKKLNIDTSVDLYIWIKSALDLEP